MTLKTLAIPLLAGLTACLSAAQPAAAGIRSLYSFCQLGGCQDGTGPGGALVKDAQGNLFGVTAQGGNINSGGVVYEILRHPRHGTARYRSLYEFCSQPACGDGSHPIGRLVIDTAGNLYGVTQTGGAVNSGVAFELQPPAAGQNTWSYFLLRSFCSSQPDCGDGALPLSGFTYAGAYTGAAYAGSSPLYGFTNRGGRYGNGVAYSLQFARSSGWTLKTLYDFCPDIGTCAGGSAAEQPVLDDAGNLYGIATSGGSQRAGAVFELSRISGSKRYGESVLHDFCSSPDCADGNAPSDLALDAAGNLYGTTSLGGSGNDCGHNCGTLFKIAPDTTYSVLYDFCSRTHCADGYQPSGITLTPSGDIYGVTRYGGRTNAGIIFRMAASMHTLYNFCLGGCAAGFYPSAAPLQDGAGTLLGVTSGNNGGVYEFNR